MNTFRLLFASLAFAGTAWSQSCDDAVWLELSQDLRRSAEKRDKTQYEAAVGRAVEFMEACPDFMLTVEELLDATDLQFTMAQTNVDVSKRPGGVALEPKASTLLIKASNARMWAVFAGVAAGVVLEESPDAAAACLVFGGINGLRGFFLERRAARQLAREGL